MIQMMRFREIKLKTPDDFLKVKETLTRMGVVSQDGKTLFQSCHILHKKSKYYIMHFKEMFILDGKDVSLSEEDVNRRDRVVDLLSHWGLVVPVVEVPAEAVNLTVIPFSNKNQYNLVAKYHIGMYSSKK